MVPRMFFLLGLLVSSVLVQVDADIDYGSALTKSLLYFEAQRSGKLPSGQRVTWRGDSALKDGSDAGIDLSGGYYDAGDNVKFGFPMAFTVSLLSWSVVEYGSKLSNKGELQNALDAIKWGTDYLINAHPAPNTLYVEVGDGNSDHQCWQRPEDMTTPRNSYKIDESKPGSDVAAETAAALAAASIAFANSDSNYASTLLTHAKQLFDFARNHRGLYQNSVPVAGIFYSSSGDDDEIAWASAWLYIATGDFTYQNFLSSENNGGKLSDNGVWAQNKNNLEQFICNVLQKGYGNTHKSPGGMLWFHPWNNLQYVTSAVLVLSIHADQLAAKSLTLQCPSGNVSPRDINSFVKSQVDYILGENPKKMSYMVGVGSSYPLQVHHRGASIVSIKKDSSTVTCQGGFSAWFYKDAPNPNAIDGAIVGGPDANDQYSDTRTNYQQAEAATVNTAPFVGVLARIA
ncbi:hypothetical protein LUZ61_017278 [Rhynchospora tenuis]|uniref:Endoglucanase n=1 Tax=Rhynchospora tenuis TaxID=198213 RepID=A0AAD6EKV2_9POAL|nr:hypothetical protein LUZ61_017278 [Rhynchospora tenuis]